jgi:MYXO-CTERM domain-containing protein
MRALLSLLLALPVLSVGLLSARDASACGGCTVPPETESTQVTGHKMILSVAKDATTLWDQIEYVGNPKDFGWVLPIKGNTGFNLDTDFSLSSDALFKTLETLTQVTVSSPTISCPPPNCGPSFGSGGGVSDGDPGAPPPDVTVVAEKVVGPFQIVHLKANVPNALQGWLDSNGYVIPPDASPVIDAYVAEQFDFVALKLVPGEGVDSMRPVRIKMPGASPELPLRMVAVGTGALTSITLWVTGEGRYEPSNFPSFEIQEKDLVWDWTTSSSNYKDLRQKGYDAQKGKAWLVEAAEPTSPFNIQFPLQDLVNFDVKNSGYGDENGAGAAEELNEDLSALYGNIPESSFWLMRFHGELPRSALATDLMIGASASQQFTQRFFQAQQTTGTAPSCPPQPECPQPPDSGNDDTWGGYFGSDSGSSGGGGCAMTGNSGASAAFGGLALVAALALSRRRRSR